MGQHQHTHPTVIELRENLFAVDKRRLDQLIELVYELLDAHDDTVRLADDLAGELTLASHRGYLCDLQRVGREVLAQVTRPVPACLSQRHSQFAAV